MQFGYGLHWALLGFLLSLCGAATAVESAYKVGVLYWSMSIPGQVAMRQGLEAEARRINEQAPRTGARGVVLLPEVAGDGVDGVERQIRQMQAMVAARPDIIVVQPSDNAALAAPLKAANAAGIPVVAYDQYISGGKLASYVKIGRASCRERV